MVTERVIREPSVRDAHQYSGRVRRLAAAYLALFILPLVGIALLLREGRFFVTLTQRSNVETLTLAFFLVFFAYIATLSARGALGALQIAYFAVRARGARDRRAIERRKREVLDGKSSQAAATAALDKLIEREGAPHQPFTIPIADDAGPMGVIAVDGAALTHRDGPGGGSNSLLGFVAEQVQQILRERGQPDAIDIVAWQSIDDEAARQYLSTVAFARRLACRLDADELWPVVRLTEGDCERLRARLTEVCPALRNERLLPDWEYEGEHKVPLIPEPLGLVSLGRTERRVDPVASMGCASLVVFAAVVALLVLIVFPPWVPGT